VSLRRLGFWGGAAAAGWVLAGYPAVLRLLPARPWAPRDDGELPRLTLVIPAYREREALRAKLAALDALDYPRERLEIVVTVDEDEQLAALGREARADARVSFAAERAGKAAAMNRALREATGEIVVMTDANNLLDPGSLRAAVRHFADPSIWAVAGKRGEQGSAYDRYEDLLRRLETRSGSTAAMSGEFMAVRRERLPQFPTDIVNDDFWLLCRIVRAGGRVVYEPQASSHEPELDVTAEVARRSRMGAGRVMALGELRDLPPGFAWRAASHKFGRLLLPFALLWMVLCSLALWRSPRYRRLALLQLAAYGTGAAAARGAVPPGPLARPARILGQFTLGNAAVAIGVVRGLRGRQSTRWEPVR
jgi:cellulose synthase/poly-beta-1,6-N-acetylglucosamine synthase-like glycosyltransferase